MIFLMIRRNHLPKMAAKVIAAVKMTGGQRRKRINITEVKVGQRKEASEEREADH